MADQQWENITKRQFIARQVFIGAGVFSVLGVATEYYRHFGWRLGFDFDFAIRALAVIAFWTVCWYLLSLWMWSRAWRIFQSRRSSRR